MPMSALGQKQTYASAKRYVRYGPKADISNYSITSSACNNIEDGTKAEGTRSVLSATIFC